MNRFGISYGVRIGFSNLLSIILYTDYSELSSHFTATFRKKWMFEPLQETKRRNKTYWWLSKILQETVHIYGQSRYEYNYDGYSERIDGLIGPFYTGMSTVNEHASISD